MGKESKGEVAFPSRKLPVVNQTKSLNLILNTFFLRADELTCKSSRRHFIIGLVRISGLKRSTVHFS